MYQKVRRRLFQRIVLFEPKSGTILDLSTRYVLSNGGPENSEEYAKTTTGSSRPTSRTNTVEVPITHREIASVASVVRRYRCPFKGIFLGPEGSDLWYWGEPARAQIQDPSVEGGAQSEKVLRMESDVFHPGIWEGMGVVEGVPWRGTSAQKRDGSFYLRPKGTPRPGYEGPLWSCPSDASVSLSGDASNISKQGKAIIEVEFPVWRTDLELFSRTGTIKGGLRALDWDGNTLAGPSKTITTPEKTWSIKASIEDASRTPIISVKHMENAYGTLEGTASPDCTRVSSPIWNNTSIVITDETF